MISLSVSPFLCFAIMKAMSGVSVVGRDYYGVFPLQGKPLNVRDANLSTVRHHQNIFDSFDPLSLQYHLTISSHLQYT